MASLPPSARRYVLAGAAVTVAAVGLGLAWKTTRDERMAFLIDDVPARWILYPAPSDPTSHPKAELETQFRRSLSLDAVPTHAHLRVRALRSFALAINGRAVAASPPAAAWKKPTELDVGPWLHPGPNTIEVTVGNDSGPPALWLWLDLADAPMVTDGTWQASWAGATWRAAALAREPMTGHPFDPDGRATSTTNAIARRWSTLLGLLGLGAALVLIAHTVWRSRLRAFLQTRVAFAVAGLAAVLWCALFIHNADLLDPAAGFDANYHLAYVAYILDHRSLPAANQGWETYQPPLYYLLAAGLLRLTGTAPGTSGGAIALRIFGLVCGIGNLFLIAGCLRRMFADNPARQVFGMVVAAFVPCQLYLFQFPTNEILAATLSSGILLVGLDLLERKPATLARYLALGACVGLALLAKLSALLVALPVVAALAASACVEPRPSRGPSLGKTAAAIAVAVALCGWHYGRTWLEFGSPFAGNWDDVLGRGWWQDPGYRTWHDIGRFGRVLVAPWFAGFEGIPDGLYATFWGDGAASGAPLLSMMPWSTDLMAAGYLVALAPTTVMATGAVATLVAWARDPRITVTAVLLVAGAVLTGIVYMAMRVPSFGQIKAFYGLGALVPLAACAAVGADLGPLRRQGPRFVLAAALVAWALLSTAALWVDAGSGVVVADRAVRRMDSGDIEGGARMLGRAATESPTAWAPRLAFAQRLVIRNATPESIAPWLALDDGREDISGRHYLLAAAARRHDRIQDALAEARRGLALDGDSAALHALAADCLATVGDLPAAAAEWAEVLRVAPHSKTAHEVLAGLLERLDRPAEAATQRKFAARLPLSR